MLQNKPCSSCLEETITLQRIMKLYTTDSYTFNNTSISVAILISLPQVMCCLKAGNLTQMPTSYVMDLWKSLRLGRMAGSDGFNVTN